MESYHAGVRLSEMIDREQKEQRLKEKEIDESYDPVENRDPDSGQPAESVFSTVGIGDLEPAEHFQNAATEENMFAEDGE